MTADNLAYNMSSPETPAEAPEGVKLSVVPEAVETPQVQSAPEGGAKELADLVAEARARAASEAAGPNLRPFSAPEAVAPQAETTTPELSVIPGGGETVDAPTPELTVVPEPEVETVPTEAPLPPDDVEEVEEPVETDPASPEEAEAPTDVDAEIAEVDRLEEQRNERAMKVVETVRAEKVKIQERKLRRAEDHKADLHRFREANALDDEAIARFEKIERDLLKRFGLSPEDSKPKAVHHLAHHRTQEHHAKAA